TLLRPARARVVHECPLGSFEARRVVAMETTSYLAGDQPGSTQRTVVRRCLEDGNGSVDDREKFVRAELRPHGQAKRRDPDPGANLNPPVTANGRGVHNVIENLQGLFRLSARADREPELAKEFSAPFALRQQIGRPSEQVDRSRDVAALPRPDAGVGKPV